MRICALACGVFPWASYVIIYRVEENDVLMLHVFRGSRDIETLLRQYKDHTSA
ncbi:MAG TPA: hypothetical protein VN946_08940 [Terriglobales bacterium]|jgi:hypothetical protein|nr:hypothetical protein [Terriglobales bacterium]